MPRGRALSLAVAGAILVTLLPLAGSSSAARGRDICTSARYKPSEFAGRRVLNAQGRRTRMTQRAARRLAASFNEADPFCTLDVSEATTNAVYDAEYLAAYGCLDEANAALDELARTLAGQPDAQDVRDLIALADPQLLHAYESDGDYEDNCDGEEDPDDGLGNVDDDGNCPWDENDDEFYYDPDCWEDMSFRMRGPNRKMHFGYSPPTVRLRDSASRGAALGGAMAAVATEIGAMQGVPIETLVKMARDLQVAGQDELSQEFIDKAREKAVKEALDFDVDPCIMSKERLMELMKKVQRAMLLGSNDAQSEAMVEKIRQAVRSMGRMANRSRGCPRWIMSMKIDMKDAEGTGVFLQTGGGTVYGSKKENGPIVGELPGLYSAEGDCYAEDAWIGRYRVAGTVKVQASGQRVPPAQLEPWFVGNSTFQNITELRAVAGAPITSGAGSLCAAMAAFAGPFIAIALPLGLPDLLGENPLRIAADQEVVKTKSVEGGTVEFKSKPDPRGPIIDE